MKLIAEFADEIDAHGDDARRADIDVPRRQPGKSGVGETSMLQTLASTARERGPASTSTPYCVVTLSIRTEPSSGNSRNNES